MADLAAHVSEAVQFFWRTRIAQREKQGSTGTGPDRGGRQAVTGGAQMDGFIELIRGLLCEAGLRQETIYHKRAGGGVTLPGFFRATKEWDLLVVHQNRLLATVELKSQVGPSFGNNYNNRSEEAIGSSQDMWTAYREGAFEPSPRPWLGYLMLLEEAPESTRPVRVSEPHFGVFPVFKGASYAKRYEVLCKRLVRERLYDAACLLLSDRQTGPNGAYREPCEELCFARFCASLTSRATEYAKLWDANQTPGP
ncbi:MAG: PaeR7I family type II restriction endonuclease [Candidatus Brocadiaceae bacterium]|jgi:hypothetical protein